MRKWIISVAAVLCCVVAAVWIESRWDVWFSMPDEPPYSGLEEPGRVLLMCGEEESERLVSWQCGEEVEKSWVECEEREELTAGETPALQVNSEAIGEVFVSRSGRAAYHVARLKGLEAGKEYRYRVCTGGKYSAWYGFRTKEKDDDGLDFLWVGDVQDTIGGVAGNLLHEALARHEEADMLVCAGDLTERPSDVFWAETFRALDGIGERLPVLCVTGNHDYLKGFPVKLERRFSLVFSYFLDSMVGENQVFALRRGNVEFFLLDTNREPWHLWTQRRWLEEKLKASTAHWKILVLHHPLYSVKGKTNNLVVRWMFDALARKYGVDLVLQGHEHAYARMTRKLEDGRETTPVYFVSHCSTKNYRIRFDGGFDKYGSGERYYQTVSVRGDTMVTAAYEATEHRLYDSLVVVKRHEKRPDTSVETCPDILDFGTQIPEVVKEKPDATRRKDREFNRRVREYRQKHPERMH